MHCDQSWNQTEGTSEGFQIIRYFTKKLSFMQKKKINREPFTSKNTVEMRNVQYKNKKYSSVEP